MKNLPENIIPQAKPVSLEDLLADMERYGEPRVSKIRTSMNSGWHASIEVHVTPVGASFDIKSEFNMPTPLAAAQQCHDRLMAAMRELGKR